MKQKNETLILIENDLVHERYIWEVLWQLDPGLAINTIRSTLHLQTQVRRLSAEHRVPGILCCHHPPSLDANYWLNLLKAIPMLAKAPVTVLDHESTFSEQPRQQMPGGFDGGALAAKAQRDEGAAGTDAERRLIRFAGSGGRGLFAIIVVISADVYLRHNFLSNLRSANIFAFSHDRTTPYSLSFARRR